MVADDILTDLFDVSLRQVSPFVRFTLSGLLKIDAAPLVNALLARAMKGSLVIEWTTPGDACHRDHDAL